jgi:hypothetical protein
MLNARIKNLVKGHIAMFRNTELASSKSGRCVKLHWILVGDHDEAGKKI